MIAILSNNTLCNLESVVCKKACVVKIFIRVAKKHTKFKSWMIFVTNHWLCVLKPKYRALYPKTKKYWTHPGYSSRWFHSRESVMCCKIWHAPALKFKQSPKWQQLFTIITPFLSMEIAKHTVKLSKMNKIRQFICLCFCFQPACKSHARVI